VVHLPNNLSSIQDNVLLTLDRIFIFS